jgi:hypothetical protein
LQPNREIWFSFLAFAMDELASTYDFDPIGFVYWINLLLLIGISDFVSIFSIFSWSHTTSDCSLHWDLHLGFPFFLRETCTKP